MNEESKREIILDVMALLVQEHDVGSLSLSDIAASADLAEADLRQLFPSLEDLVKAAVERMYQAFLDRIAHELGDDEAPGAWTRAFIRASCAEETGKDFPRIGRVLLSSVVYKPDLVEPLRNRQDELFSAMHGDGLDPMKVYTVRTAMEGLWMSEMFGMDLLPPDRKDAFIAYLIGLTEVALTLERG